MQTECAQTRPGAHTYPGMQQVEHVVEHLAWTQAFKASSRGLPDVWSSRHHMEQLKDPPQPHRQSLSAVHSGSAWHAATSTAQADCAHAFAGTVHASELAQLQG